MARGLELVSANRQLESSPFLSKRLPRLSMVVAFSKHQTAAAFQAEQFLLTEGISVVTDT